MNATATNPDIRRLAEADAAMLRQHWTQTKGTAPPRTFTARLMRLALAWEAQAALGEGETAKSRHAWKRVIRVRTDTRSAQANNGIGQATVGDGTRILKEWGGTMHEVLVADNGGATWKGQSYSSLSAVARAMTGTNRNGPKFFGLREGAKP